MKFTVRIDGMGGGKGSARAADLARRLVAERQDRSIGGQQITVADARANEAAPPQRR